MSAMQAVSIMIEKLKKLEKKVTLSPVHKILLTTDGSITRVLEALRGEKVRVETIAQVVQPACKKVAKLLNVKVGEKVNYRAVTLRDSNRVLVHAVSYAPVARLKPEFHEDVMRKDVPIGRIMEKLKIEARREVKSFGTLRCNSKLCKIFGIRKGKLLLKRNYNIIHSGEILLNITEIFPHEVFA